LERAKGAWAHFRAARLLLKMQRLEEAEKLYEQAVRLQEQLVAEFPEEPDRRVDLVWGYLDRSSMHGARNRPADAKAVIRQAVTLAEELVREAPDNMGYRYLSAAGYNYLANWSPGSGLALRRKALVLMEPLQRADRKETIHVYCLLEIYYNLGIGADLTEAEELFAKALTLCEHLDSERARLSEIRSYRAHFYHALGVRLGASRPAEAEKALVQAIEIRTALAQDFPKFPVHQEALAEAYRHLGGLYLQATPARPAEAEAAFRDCLRHMESLIHEHPEVLNYSRTLGQDYMNFGSRANAAGRPEDALKWYSRAVETLEAPWKKEPQNGNAQELLCAAFAGQAETLGNLHLYAEALSAWNRMLELHTGPDLTYRFKQAGTLAHMGSHAQAAAAVEAVLQKSELSRKDLFNAAGIFCLSITAAHKDANLPPTEQNKLAKDYALRAVELLKQACSAAPPMRKK
jgi:tetratricopeptide (TPR) repeat protein